MTYVDEREAALNSFNSSHWANVKTEAQGDLTAHLAKHHYDSYGGHWNKLANRSRALIDTAVKARLTMALEREGLPAQIVSPILFDVIRATLEISYRKRFRRAPVFFERMLRVYGEGRLPCGWEGRGWDGTFDHWPRGKIIVF